MCMCVIRDRFHVCLFVFFWRSLWNPQEPKFTYNSWIEISRVPLQRWLISGGSPKRCQQTASAHSWIDVKPIRGTQALWLVVWLLIQLLHLMVVLAFLNDESQLKGCPACDWLGWLYTCKLRCEWVQSQIYVQSEFNCKMNYLYS